MNTNNIIKRYDIKNIENYGFILHNDENNEIVHFCGKFAYVQNKQIDYGLVIGGNIRRDKCDDINTLSSFFKAGNSVYAISIAKQCIVRIDPTNIIIANYVFLPSEETYNYLICDQTHIFAVSSVSGHMKNIIWVLSNKLIYHTQI